jgi:hypothetical protein
MATDQLPRELMESCLAASQEATFQGFSDSVLKDKITRLHETVYRMGFESGWRIREQQIAATPAPISRISGDATTSPAEKFAEWCRKHGLQPEKCDDSNIWIRHAFDGGIAAGVPCTMPEGEAVAWEFRHAVDLARPQELWAMSEWQLTYDIGKASRHPSGSMDWPRFECRPLVRAATPKGHRGQDGEGKME